MQNKKEWAACIADIEKHCFADAWSLAAIEKSMELPYNRWHLLMEEAYIHYRIVGDEAELLRIGVLPEARKRGQGSALLRAMLEDLEKEKVRRCFLEVRCSNHAAISLYRKFGFQESGRRKAYYNKPVEDALLMEWEAERI